jgi:uncharacterized protein YggT (Ycf19 family)
MVMSFIQSCLPLPNPHTVAIDSADMVTELLGWVTAWLAQRFAELSKPEEPLGELRTRDLRRALLRLGATEDEVARRIDKLELVELGRTYLAAARRREILWVLGFFLLVSFVVYVLVSIRGHLVEFVRWTALYVLSRFKPVKRRWKKLKIAVKNALPLAAVCVLLSILVELYMIHVQLSVLASWLLPSYSPLRRYLAPMASFSVSPSMLNRNWVFSQDSGASSMMGLDVGPMITLGICRYTRNFLDGVAARQLSDAHRD